jgi:hypothetical protein
MGDSVEIRNIPQTVDIVATYDDGSMGIVPAGLLEQLFPSDKYFHVFIDVTGARPDAHVRDWENGDKGGDLEKWVIDHNKHTGKKDAVIYCNRSTITEVRRLTKSQVLGKDYFLWISTLDDTVFQGEGVIACQNKGAAQLGKDWDSSVVFVDDIWPTPPPPATSAPPKPICSGLQRALRTTMDNVWGTETDKSANALIKAWSDEFPYGVQFAQFTVGTRGDGFWGPNSKAAMHDTTASVQRALNVMKFNPGQVDGIWSPKTDAAYLAARKACHV